jgi:hypothetical protein
MQVHGHIHDDKFKLLSDSYSNLVYPMMYKQLIGSLMYLVNTRSDICFAVNALSQYMVEPRHVHWMEVMQEHPHFIKRASAWSKEHTAGQRQHIYF